MMVHGQVTTLDDVTHRVVMAVKLSVRLPDAGPPQ